MQVKTKHDFDFQVVPAGWHVFRIESADAEAVPEEKQKKNKQGDTNVMNYVVKMRPEGGDGDGAFHTEYFPFTSKDDIGMQKMASLLMKTGVMPTTDGYDTEVLKTDGIKTKVRTQLPKSLVGGYVKHSKGDKEGSVFANIVKWATPDEARKLMEGKKDAPTAAAGKPGNTDKPAPAPVKDPWA